MPDLFLIKSTNDTPMWLLILKGFKIVNFKCNSHALHEGNKEETTVRKLCSTWFGFSAWCASFGERYDTLVGYWL